MIAIYFLMTVFFTQSNYALTVRVNAIKDIKGQMYLAFYRSSVNFLDESKIDIAKVIPVTTDEMTITWDDFPENIYAIAIFQDLNNNKILDKNILGIPVEPYGFSNNPKLLFGPPSFEKCKVDLIKNRLISIQLN